MKAPRWPWCCCPSYPQTAVGQGKSNSSRRLLWQFLKHKEEWLCELNSGTLGGKKASGLLKVGMWWRQGKARWVGRRQTPGILGIEEVAMWVRALVNQGWVIRDRCRPRIVRIVLSGRTLTSRRIREELNTANSLKWLLQQEKQGAFCL